MEESHSAPVERIKDSTIWWRFSAIKRVFTVLGVAGIGILFFCIDRSYLRHSFYDLLLGTWRLFRAEEGTSGPGFISNIITPLVSIVATWLLILRERGKEAGVKHFREEAFLAIRVVIVVSLTIYGPMALWCVVRSVYDDHHNMAVRWQDTVKEKDKLKSDLKKRDTYIETLEKRAILPGMPRSRKPTSIPRVDTINLTYSPYDSIHTDAPYCTKLVLTSKIPVKNLGLQVTLSSSVKYVDPLFTFVYKGFLKVDSKRPTQVNIAMLGFNDNVLLPERPIIVSVCSDKPIVPTALERRNVIEE